MLGLKAWAAATQLPSSRPAWTTMRPCLFKRQTKTEIENIPGAGGVGGVATSEANSSFFFPLEHNCVFATRALAQILSQFCRQIVPRVDLVRLVPSPLIHCSRCLSCVGISSDGTYTSRFLPHSALEKTEKKASTVVLQTLPLSL